MDQRFTWTIKEIMADPRYREFARDATEHGKQVVPDKFPWCWMGRSDSDIYGAGIMMESGLPMTDAGMQDAIAVIRAQEKLVITWWIWWQGWQAIDARHAEAAEPPKGVAAARPAPGMLF